MSGEDSLMNLVFEYAHVYEKAVHSEPGMRTYNDNCRHEVRLELEKAIREVCEERDRLRDELAAAHQQIFDLTLKVNNPAWLPGI